MTMPTPELIEALRDWDFSRGGPWQGHARAEACMSQAAAEIERLQARLARVEFAVTSTGGDEDRSEFHRGWAACCKMITAAARAPEQKEPT